VRRALNVVAENVPVGWGSGVMDGLDDIGGDDVPSMPSKAWRSAGVRVPVQKGTSTATK